MYPFNKTVPRVLPKSIFLKEHTGYTYTHTDIYDILYIIQYILKYSAIKRKILLFAT